MSETGQPGAATPGEHGDEPGQQDDLARPVGGWAPPASGWSGGGDVAGARDAGSPWHRPEPPSGWAASSPRHGDLPAPLPGLPADSEPPARTNGHHPHLNGVSHTGEEPPVGRPGPVSAPPFADVGREAHDDRVAVPAQRPAPAGERPVRGQPEAGPARHSSDDPSAPRASRWSDGYPGHDPAGPAHRSGGDEVGRPPADERGVGRGRPDERAPLPEPGWAGPDWNRPSWSGGWAPPWARDQEEPAGRRARDDDERLGWRGREEDELVGRRMREEDEPVGRRAREDRAADWAPEPSRGYPPEPSRPHAAEQARPYEPVGDESARPYPPPVGDEPARPYPAMDPTELRAARPFRLRPVPEDASADEALGHPPTPTAAGPVAAPVSSGIGRLVRTPPEPAPTETSPYAAETSPYAARRLAADQFPPADEGRQPDHASAVLPQRVPAEPDVPVVPEPPAVDPPAETPELARIATHLRRDDEPAPPQERPEGFDVNAILDAVRGVAGVRDAALRRTQAGAHSLRLDLADGADPAEVSRQVARLLQDRMGLAAAPQNIPGMPSAPPPPPPVRRRSAEARVDHRTDPRNPVARAPEGRPAEVPPRRADPAGEPPRRRRQASAHRGRAAVEEPGQGVAFPPGVATGSPATLAASYSGGQMTTTETAPSRPLDTGGVPGPRVVIDHVQVSTFGLDATVEVRLLAGAESASGYASGPAVDGYLLRLCAVAAAAAVDRLLRDGDQEPDRERCFVEHAAVVSFGNCEVATVVVLLVCDGWVEQLAGSALVAGDPRQAAVRATLAAVNRRIEALLA
ncbi:hypothetical protein [Micromonospora okii]|uniref:hypothetical protein n=1 Tax=Micromonospora okii TaxID=1182970 RepID=UPI001E4DEA2E|nr:hypothetical protein [Micromonospora okii]